MNDQVSQRVRRFYEEMPFNYYASPEAATSRIVQLSLEQAYPDLHRWLTSGRVRSVLEVGCGCGWLASGLAYHYGLTVTALDFSEAAVSRARRTAQELGVSERTEFLVADLHDYETARRFELVISLGVLHHIGDARRACHRIQAFVPAGGVLYLGLYHQFGRRVFLDLLRGILEEEGEDAAFRRYRTLDRGRQADDVHLRSWFRDQVLHPHETQHTLEEVGGWLEADGLKLVSTSINGFRPFDAPEEIYAEEARYEELSYRANVIEGRYFPGFFTAMGRRTDPTDAKGRSQAHGGST